MNVQPVQFLDDIKNAPKPLGDAFFKKKAAEQNSLYNKIKKITTHINSELEGTGTVSTIAKIIKNTANYFFVLSNDLIAKNIINFTGSVSDSIKALGFFKGVRDLVEYSGNKKLSGTKFHENNLAITSSIFQCVIGGATFTKLLDQFQVIKLANVSLSLGTTAFPFSAFTGTVEIVKSLIDLARGSITINEVRIKQNNLEKKQNLFNNESDQNSLEEFIRERQNHSLQKQESAITKLAALNEDLEKFQNISLEANTKYKEAEKALNDKDSSYISRISPLWKRRQAINAFVEATTKYEKIKNKIDKLTKANEKNINNYESWAKVSTNFVDRDAIAQEIVKAKSDLWEAKSKNNKWSLIEQGVGISIGVIATIGLIFSLVVSLSGIGIIPVALTITSLFLVTSLLGFAKPLIKKYKPQYQIPVFDINNYIKLKSN